ncbi:long-chain acyl-CoA synthetase [Algoriella xinjiangensis]|uniref:Long-chain acyl-CoA synthetase n=1 Tax=Algoriella xinjiangensis TaxID=684065 RepID=A0A1I4S733_9FLAO|nr:long-chain fatty acid--CoA ligase [Algoriella xinjiangensis]SFM60073.1 long-chain acyl-CoA synthetase [Algoriella xinjiangensis]VDH15925.1 Long-chain-fatty-acid--CoA ligase FadD15 [Algoriella xinjiangensis]
MTTPQRIFDLPRFQEKNTPGITIFNYKENKEWKGISTADFIKRVNNISKGLLAHDVQPNDKVALISENRLEWNLLDFAIQQIGAVVVAIYPNISDNDYEFILNNAEIKLCVVSTDSLYQRLLGIKDKINIVEQVYTFNSYLNTPNWVELISKGIDISDETLELAMNQVKTTDLATIIYTSGTTGNPKGVMLTHENLLADVDSSEYSFPVKAYDKALSFLPACHAYERVFQYVYIKMGLPIYYAQSMETIGADMKEVQPHIFSAVPRVLEKVYDKIMATGEQLTGVKRKLFFWAIALGEQYDTDETKFSAWYKFQLKIARKLIFSKWKDALGGHIKGVASGSATLQTKLLRLYLAAGIPIYEGYGLTEAGPCLSVNCIKRGMKIGTVGIPLINIDIKLAEDGEILAKGKNIMLGYYKNPEATAEVLKDGWLYTGDIGEWVDEKFLKIIDRKKEMFKTSGGKYVVPQQIEAKLSESTFIEQIMVVGEGRKFPSALIVPAYQNLMDWAKTNDSSLIQISKSEFLANAKIKTIIEEEVNRLNVNFGNWEKIKKFAIIPNEFTIETGELTPTLKMKRKIILAKYENEINEIYK